MCVLPSLSYVEFRPGTIVGNVMYWVMSVNHLFSFNMIDSSMSYIEQPHEVDTILRRNVHVMKIRNHELGVAAVINFEMRIWRMEADLDETICWIPHKVIQLQRIISFPRTTPLCWKPKAILLHVFEDREMVIVRTADGVYEVDICNEAGRKLFGPEVTMSVYSYATLYIPGRFLFVIEPGYLVLPVMKHSHLCLKCRLIWACELTRQKCFYFGR